MCLSSTALGRPPCIRTGSSPGARAMLVRALQQMALRLEVSPSGMPMAPAFTQSGTNMLWSDGLEAVAISILLVEGVILRANVLRAMISIALAYGLLCLLLQRGQPVAFDSKRIFTAQVYHATEGPSPPPMPFCLPSPPSSLPPLPLGFFVLALVGHLSSFPYCMRAHSAVALCCESARPLGNAGMCMCMFACKLEGGHLLQTP